MKNKPKALLALALLLCQPAMAQQQASQAKAEAMKCLSAPMGSANFNWSIQLAQDLSQKLDARLGFDQLKQGLAANNAARDAVRDAVKKSLGMTVQNFDPMTFLKPGFNVSTEIINLVNRFAENLRPALANVRVDQETNFQIMIAPKLSDELAARRAGGGDSREIPIMTQYPNDRLVLFQNLGEADSAGKSADERIVTEIYAGISQYFNQAYECKLTQPFLTSALINVKITPVIQDSQISAQIILGMPSGLEIPFTEGDPTIRFQKIVFPKVNGAALSINNGGIPDASQYPVAIVNMHQKLVGSTDIPVHIEFGPLGTYKNKKWMRVPTVEYSSLVPKLKGVVQMNAITRAAVIDFNIYNLSMNLAKQEVTDIDVFLSVGYRRFPNMTFLRINRTDVDSQFQSEINRNIQMQIAAQKENLKRYSAGNLSPQEQQAIADAAVKLGDQKGVSPELTKQLIQTLFGAMGAKQ